MTRPEHAAHDSDRFYTYSEPRRGCPPQTASIQYRDPVQIGAFWVQNRYNPVQSGTIGYRLVEIGYSLPDLYRDASSTIHGETRATQAFRFSMF